LLQRSATEHSSTYHCIRCLHSWMYRHKLQIRCDYKKKMLHNKTIVTW
jgi:hypothetical protein